VNIWPRDHVRSASVLAGAFVIACTGAHERNTLETSVGDLRLSPAYLVEPAGDAPAAMYFTVRNTGTRADTLVSVSVQGFTTSQLHETTPSHGGHGGGSMMMHTAIFPIASRDSLVLAPGRRHVMLTGPQKAVKRGERITAIVTFRNAGPVTYAAQVVAYAQLDSLLHVK
jgi:copper(I)-binding protein